MLECKSPGVVEYINWVCLRVITGVANGWGYARSGENGYNTSVQAGSNDVGYMVFAQFPFHRLLERIDSNVEVKTRIRLCRNNAFEVSFGNCWFDQKPEIWQQIFLRLAGGNQLEIVTYVYACQLQRDSKIG
jgi:hypothetical protein